MDLHSIACFEVDQKIMLELEVAFQILFALNAGLEQSVRILIHPRTLFGTFETY